MYIPDPSELLENAMESQFDLVDENNTYPCVKCKRRFDIDDMFPISSHPAASLECGREDCREVQPKGRNVDSYDGKERGEVKTNQEIINSALELARLFYKSMGNEVKKGYKFYEANHPQEKGMWNLAVIAYAHIEGTDLEDILYLNHSKSK